MDMSHLKTQIMTMFMMKSGTRKSGDDSNNEIFQILYGMMLMSIVEWVFRVGPGAFAILATWIGTHFKGKTPTLHTLLDKSKKDVVVNSITMTRVYPAEADNKVDNVYVEKIDAVLDYICNLDNAKHIRIDTRYSINNPDEIVLTPLIQAKVKQSGTMEEGAVIEILLYSTSLKVSEIRTWVDEIHNNYVFEKNNKLGNKIFYFNEVVSEPIVQQEMLPDGEVKKTYRWETMPRMLTFTMNEFRTSKSFSNVYGHHVDELKERLELFLHHPEWYMDRGIPHSLGIMLHGIPGAGKTSTIKAIAKDTHRHIFNLSLRPFTSQRQLTNLFYNETVVVHGYDGQKQTLKIPLNKRIYVIEDIDCLTDVVLDRSLTSSSSTPEGDAVTLSFLLNLLDGVLETPGRILIITSNYPDKLDKAFVRPGRIDVKIDFTYACREFILDMINRFYSIQKELCDIPDEIVDVYTPAEVMESMCMHFKNPDMAIQHLVAKRKLKQDAVQGMLLESLVPTEPHIAEIPQKQELPTESSADLDAPRLEIKDADDDPIVDIILQKHTNKPLTKEEIVKLVKQTQLHRQPPQTYGLDQAFDTFMSAEFPSADFTPDQVIFGPERSDIDLNLDGRGF